MSMNEEIESRLSELLASLTFEERVLLVTGKGSWHTKDFNGKLPYVTMSDGPHGLRKQDEEEYADLNKSNPATCFPTGSALASGWDPDNVAAVAKAIAEEARAERVSVVLGPAINIKRSPLCGRNFEYLSEDPYLAGTLATSYVKAMQAEGVGTSVKHFACNSQETMRQTSDSFVDERALHEIYLRAFELCVKEAQPATIMASYNRINGTYACANKELLTDLLRGKWHYEGAVISDWGAAIDLPQCLKAGMDLEMPDSNGYHSKKVMNALDRRHRSPSTAADGERGTMTLTELNRAVLNVLRLALAYPTPKEGVPCDLKAHHALARRVAAESAVLLKHTGAFPLSKEERVLLVGPMAEVLRFQGGGSSHITTLPCQNVIEALKAAGCNIDYRRSLHPVSGKKRSAKNQEALRPIAEYDKILYFGGLTDEIEGEGYDRQSLDFPEDQLAEIRELTAQHKHVSVVTFGGAPMLLPFYEEVEDILHMHLGGQAVGEACADLLTGAVNPCGKLAETWPASLSSVPCSPYYGRRSDNVPYVESIFVGYRYYESFRVPVLFPFGYGLSYTTFAYDEPEVILEDNGRVKVRYVVTNTGSVAGAEISQVYIGNPSEYHNDTLDRSTVLGRVRPRLELRGFSKDYLKPGESKKIEVTLDDHAFMVYDAGRGDFVTVEGTYTIAIGGSARDIRLRQAVDIAGAPLERFDAEDALSLSHDGKTVNLTEYGPSFNTKTFARIYGRPLADHDRKRRGEFTIYDSMESVCRHSLFGRIFLGAVTALLPLILHGNRNDPATKLVLAALREAPLDGLIGVSGGMVKPNLSESLVLHANKKPFSGWVRLLAGNRRSDRL